MHLFSAYTPKISAWTPAETSPFIFDLLQAKFFHVDSGLQMENGSEQFGMLEGNAANHFSPSPRWTFKNWQTFLFFHSGWYFPPDINQLSSERRTVVHTSSLLLLSNVYRSVCLWQRPHRPRLFRMSPSSFLLSIRLFTHSSIRPLIHWYSIWPASVVSGPKGTRPTYCRHRQQPDQPGDYSDYGLCLHRVLLLCATSPLVSWQPEF